MIFCSVFSLRKPVGNSLRTAFYSQEGGGGGGGWDSAYESGGDARRLT